MVLEETLGKSNPIIAIRTQPIHFDPCLIDASEIMGCVRMMEKE